MNGMSGMWVGYWLMRSGDAYRSLSENTTGHWASHVSTQPRPWWILGFVEIRRVLSVSGISGLHNEPVSCRLCVYIMVSSPFDSQCISGFLGFTSDLIGIRLDPAGGWMSP